MRETLGPTQEEYEVTPDKEDVFERFMKATGVRIPKRPVTSKSFFKTHDVDRVLGLLNPSSPEKLKDYLSNDLKEDEVALMGEIR